MGTVGRLATTLALVALTTQAGAESPQDLVGTWKGYSADARTKEQANRVELGFTIKTIQQQDGKWAVEAVDLRGRPLHMVVTIEGEQVYVEYRRPGNEAVIRLRLDKGRLLVGASQRGVRVDRDVRLEKQAQ